MRLGALCDARTRVIAGRRRRGGRQPVASSASAGRSVSMRFSDDVSLEDLRQAAEAFARERDWEQFHSPRNLLLAVASEVGEACDLVRWLGDGDDRIPTDIADDWADELADILILLIRLADCSSVDLPRAFQAKLAKAAAKYPVAGFRGSNRKYR